MIKHFFTVVLVIFNYTLFGQLRNANDLKGIWSGHGLRVEFVDDSKMAVVFPDGQKKSGSYHADFFHSPVTLEIYLNDGLKKVAFKCLIELQQNTVLRWQLFEQTDDPKNFSGASYILTKIKN